MEWVSGQATIAVASEVPIQTLASLAVTDGSGNLILDGKSNPIMPFAGIIDPVSLVFLSATDSVKTISFTDSKMGGCSRR
jgi:hypothetical protein